jgi:hypothetical protein
MYAGLMVWNHSKKRGISCVSEQDEPLRPAKQVKKMTIGSGPCSRLRSGPVLSHPLVIEAATMQVDSLSQFELTPPESPTHPSQRTSIILVSSQDSEASSDPLILDVWSQQSSQPGTPSTPRPSGLSPATNTPATAPSSMPTPVSATTNAVPRRPTSSARSLDWSPSQVQPRSWLPRTPPGQIPQRLEEAFESEPEGFDAETLELITQMQARHRRQVSSRGGPGPNGRQFVAYGFKNIAAQRGMGLRGMAR